MTDKILGYILSFLAVTAGVIGIHDLIQSGNARLRDYCMALWLAWVVLLLARVMREFAVALKRGDTLIQPSVLEPLILIPLTFILLDVIGRNATELSIKPVWVCVVIAALMVMGAIRLSELIFSRVLDPLMGLIFRTSRKAANNRYAPNIPVVCRSCIYCTAHTHLLCAIRPLGPEHPRYCSSFKARKNEELV